jgi:hypothetical protein
VRVEDTAGLTSGGWRWLYPVAIYLAHLGLVAYAAPPKVIFGSEPLMGVDYQTHFEQSRTVSEAITRWGKTWAYDPFLLAGQPAGLIFDVDNKAHSLFFHALTRLGLDQAPAFNLFALLTHLLAPLLIWLAARLLGTGFRPRTISLALAVLIWHFDSACHWYWWAGMCSFALASHLCVLIVVLFYLLLERGQARFWVPLLVLLPLALVVHVWSFAILSLPLIALYVRRWRRLGLAGHGRVLSLAAAAVLANAFWLWPALEHLHFISLSGRAGQGTPLTLLSDYLDLFVSVLMAGTIGTHTLFRFAALLGAFLTLARWRRDRDRRFFVGALALCWCLVMAYLFSLVPLLDQTEPYRFILPATLLAVLLSGPWWARVLTRGWVQALPPVGRAALVVLLVLLVPRAFRTVAYFIPHLVPEDPARYLPRPNVAGPRALEPVERYIGFRHDTPPQDYKDLARYLVSNCTEQGRVLVEGWVTGEYLRWATDKQIIGGFPDRRMIHEAANIFRYLEDPRHKGRALADYLVRYNIRYVVVSHPMPWIERRRDLLQPQRLVGPHRIYRVRHLGSYFATGSGRVRASLNRLEVDDARPHPGTQALVLRYHYLHTLRCSPHCKLARVPLPDNPVGFIQVTGQPKLPRRFTIENRY